MDNGSQKTKILFVVTKSNMGGAQKYVFDLATNLPKDQFEAVVATGGSGALIQKLNNHNIRVVPIPSLSRDVNTGNDLRAFFELLKIFQKEKPAVVHLNSAKAGGVGALAAHFAGVPKVIFTAHGWAFNEERPYSQRVAIKFFSWLTVVLSHKTIAVSNAVFQDTQDWPFTKNKVVTIHNGIHTENFYSKKEAREKLTAHTGVTLPQNAIVVGTIAELHKNKGLKYAILAFAKLIPANPNLYYFIIGDGEQRKYLKNLIEFQDLHGRVFLLGFTEDAARILPSFDIFLLPSIKEGLPYVLLEAGLAKLPIVATEVGGIPEVIGNNAGILVPSRDSDSISSAIKNLIDTPSLCEKLAQTINEKVNKDFSFDRVLSQTINLYNGK